ncbi:MAG: di-trans,poly-cis-decaprenylcistransferase [Synergistaceae bacterium]|jgi:undecaprenyl diphosphate synthase|nr:polyprenyl diphosphate synthase [Synergistaceae bacterium]MCK9435868.1 polyprenyl diphosphate synthase [Synergistaceae bacterium]MDD2349855.1 polyprenyl diphosphate synthase [Synergistaceae bacterium]MDD3318394.1 polyprenyl diphosphate synthase [Synergistaceae bacterium]MDD3671944.1 polyprenyl diphosphate synthase [Synergistaceae bacterium]
MEEKILNHIGIIMDGNRRWARSRGLPAILGHREGVKAVERTLIAAKELGIPCVSLYAFSTENWKRPKSEVLGLMGLLKYYMKLKLEELNKENARIRFAGNISALSEDIQEILLDAEQKTRNNDSMQLVVCLNYGGRQEILDAVNKMIGDGVSLPVTEDVFRKYLYLPDLPDPDLLIRTSGELRMSNFWLWQGSYSEFYFTDKFWPDFGKPDLEMAIADYYRRERRYGKA